MMVHLERQSSMRGDTRLAQKILTDKTVLEESGSRRIKTVGLPTTAVVSTIAVYSGH